MDIDFDALSRLSIDGPVDEVFPMVYQMYM